MSGPNQKQFIINSLQETANNQQMIARQINSQWRVDSQCVVLAKY